MIYDRKEAKRGNRGSILSLVADSAGRVLTYAVAKPIVGFVRRQIARRGADFAKVHLELGTDKEIEEALAVLSGEAMSLPADLWVKFKAFVSQRPPSFETDDSKLFIADDRAVELVKSGVRRTFRGEDVRPEREAARALHSELFDGDGAYGETLIDDAISFSVLTLIPNLPLDFRILLIRLAENQSELVELLEMLKKQVADLQRRDAPTSGAREKVAVSPDTATPGEWIDLRGMTQVGSEANEAVLAERRSVLGLQPSTRALKLGLYQPREKRLNEVGQACAAWFEQWPTTNPLLTLPIFWIKGRSGDGKSVLLLQLAARMMAQYPDVGMVRLTAPERLVPLIEALRDSPRRVIIVADDLHKAQAIDNLPQQLELLLELGVTNVAILACGPTPEYDAFRHACRKQISAPAWAIPPTTAEERSEMAAWLGVDPDAVGANAELLVEFLFELKVGEPIDTFAENFRKRLEAQGAFDDVQPIIAATALDTSAELGLLPGNDAGDFLRRLGGGDQRHFDLESQLPSGRAGVRFAHAQIAARLFAHWWSKPLLGNSIMRPLADALAPALLAVCQDAGDASQLVRGLLTRYAALEPGAAANAGIQVARMLVDRVSAEPAAQAWLIAAILDRSLVSSADADGLTDRALELAISPTVPRAARCRLAGNALLYSLAHTSAPPDDVLGRAKAVLFDPDNGHLTGTWIVTLTSRHPDQAVAEWPYEWLPLSIDALSFAAVAEWVCNRTGFRPGVAQLLLARVKSDLGKRDAGRLLKMLITVLKRLDPDQRADVLATTNEWLKDSSAAPADAPEVLKTLLSVMDILKPEQREKVLRSSFEWLGEPRQPPPAAQNVITALLAAGSYLAPDTFSRAVHYGLSWLGKPDEAPFGAQDVLRSLLSTPVPLAAHVHSDIVNYAIAWVGEPGKAPFGAQEVLKSLLAAFEQIEPKLYRRVIGCVLTWLGEPDAAPTGTQEVLKVLLSGPARLEPAVLQRVVRYALAWLKEPASAPPSGQEVLKGLLTLGKWLEGDLRGAVSRYTLEWLTMREGRDSNASTVFKLMATFQGSQGEEVDEALRAWGLKSLEAHPAHSTTATIASGLCALASDDASTRERLKAWAKSCASENSIIYFLSHCHRLGPDPELRALAEAKLDSASNPMQQARILFGLVQAYPDAADVTARMFSHLRRAKAPLGPQICSQWFRRRADPVEALGTLLACADGAAGGSVRFSVAIALARNLDPLFAAFRDLPLHRQDLAISLLGHGVAVAEGSARALLDRLDLWPPAYASGLFCALLKSKLPSPSIALPLLKWLTLHERSPRRGIRDVDRCLAEHPTRYNDLQDQLSNQARLRVARERLDSGTSRPRGGV